MIGIPRPSRMLRRALMLAGGLAAAGAALLVADRVRPANASVTVDSTRTFQTIHGWEATAEAGLDDVSETQYREYLDEVLDEAVDLGLTRLRLEVRASYEHTRDIEREYRTGAITAEEWRCARYATVNDDNDPNHLVASGFRFDRLDRTVEAVVQPFRARLARAGLPFWLNAQYVAFTDQICDGHAYDHDNPDEYAEFVVAVYQHLQQKYGFVPDSWEVALEPDNTRVWTGDRMAQAMLRTADRLTKAGFTPRFVAPGTTAAGNALRYFEPIWREPLLRPLVYEISYHRYRSASDRTVAGIGRAAGDMDVATSMLEMIGAGPVELHADLTLGQVSAWQQYVLAFPAGDTGAHYLIVDPDAPAGNRVTPSATAVALRPYFRALRPGAVRVAATSSDSSVTAVAARNIDGRMALVLHADRGGNVRITGLDAGRYQVTCARAPGSAAPRDGCDRLVDVDGVSELSMSVDGAGVFSVLAIGTTAAMAGGPDSGR